MENVKDVIEEIKSLKIQGAEAVALSSIEALKGEIKAKGEKSYDGLLVLIEKTVKLLASSRPTEPLLRNCLNYVRYGFEKKKTHKKMDAVKLCDYVISHIEKSKKEIARIGEKKIGNGTKVFTHCHSSTVVEILKLAKENGKDFIVYNTETRPAFQGRKTAKELSACGIKVYHMVDSAARIGLKNADIALIGSDAITSEGRVINKIGSELFSEIARRYDIPFYSCTNSWKMDPLSLYGFDEPIEERKAGEVWSDAPKGVTILNPAFEIIRSDLVTGIISELGVYTPELFVSKVQNKYPFLFLNQKP